MSLRWMFILYVLLPFGVAAAALGWFGVDAAQKHMEARLVEDMARIGHVLEPSLTGALDGTLEQEQQREYVHQALEGAFHFGQVFNAYLYDTEGRLIARAGETEAGHTPVEALQSVLSERTQMQRRSIIEGQEFYSHFQPIAGESDQVSAVLHLARDEQELSAPFQDIRVTGLMLVLAATLITSLLVGFTHRLVVGRPLDRLLRTLDSIRLGGPNARAPVTGPREFADVARSVNHMLNNLERSQRTIIRQAQTQRSLRNQLAESEQLAAVGRLATGTAHELGTPVSIINAKLRRLRQRLGPEHDADAELRSLAEQSGRIEATLQQMLHLGSASAGHAQEIRVGVVVDRAVHAARPLCHERGVRLDLQPPGAEVTLFCDPVRVEQALVCLLQNAADATPSGQVNVSWRQDGEWIQLCVEDNGPGMAREVWQRAVEPFYSTKAASGRGFGLALVAGVVEEHGGRLDCETGDLGGARITMQLPATLA